MATRPRKRAADTEIAPVISSGCLDLDRKLGRGGWPRGRIVEIYGPEGAGKTTLVLEAIAQAIRDGGTGALIDADHGVDALSARRFGIDFDQIAFHQTNVLEEAFAKAVELAHAGNVDVIALDSIAALIPKEQHRIDDLIRQKDEGHRHQIEHALKVLLEPLAQSRATLLITNQIREKVGVMYGNPETIPWATTALRDFASVRVEVRKVTALKDGERLIGQTVRAKVVKSRLSPPSNPVEFHLLFDSGIDQTIDLLDVALDVGTLTKNGSSVSFGERRLGSVSAVVELLRSDTELAEQVRADVLSRIAASKAEVE